MASRPTLEPQPSEMRPLPPVPPDTSSPPHKRRWLWVLILIVIGVAIWYFRGAKAKQTQMAATSAHARQAGMPVPVVVATATAGDLPLYYTGLGTVTASNTVTIHTHVDGQIMVVHFKEGEFVRKGDPLVEIDPRPYQVQLEQAQGQFAKDTAALHDASVNATRYQALFAAGVIPKQQMDTQVAAAEQLQGSLKSDQAQIDSAKLELTYCHITSPIEGRVGLRLVDAGNIVHASDQTGLLVITQVHPIAAIFTLPQDQMMAVYKKLRQGAKLPADAYDRDDTTKIASGTLLTIDNQIDTTTGTYKLKAMFPNADNALFPNQFVNIHLLVDTKQGLVIIPAAALQRGPQGTYVYAVAPGNTVKIHTVAVALTNGNQIGLSNGLQPGDQVVTDGLDKLQDGSKIEPRSATGGPSTPSAQNPAQNPRSQAPGQTPGAPSPTRPRGTRSRGPQK
ncbi:MAG: MdtA/MuxA family multidrug efflux RND transporter periplasmic adaptor subunit [Candidatus Acidiferrales bacterium]